MSLAAPNPELDRQTELDNFVEYLRHPGFTARKSAEEIAKQFGLNPEFVQDVLNALHNPTTHKPAGQQVWQAVGRSLSEAYQFLKKFWLSVTANPMVFVIVTGIAGYVATFAYQTSIVSTNNGERSFNVGQILTFTFILHQLCYARHGKLRYPLYGAAAAAVATFIANVGLPRAEVGRAELILGAILSGSLYAVLGGMAALLGGYFGIRKRDRQIRRLSRHEALNRLFVLRERVAKLSPKLESKKVQPNWLEAAQGDPRWPLNALIAGFAFGVLRVVVLGGYQHLFPNMGGQNDPIYWTFRIFSVIVTGLAFLGIGFLSGSFGRAVASQFIAFFGLWLSNFVTLGGFGPEMALGQLNPAVLIPMSVLLLMSGVLSGLGTLVEADARRERRRAHNDPASIVAEIVQLQRYLNADSAARCVVSVDVARSTAMKSDQDPLIVEWSFREYQNLLCECASDACGNVLSTSGDGAVLSFSHCSDALAAAKDIQTRINWFNMRVNRLDAPFRVRIGIHTDEVQGVLEDIQFTEVIDIAAHVQTHAPVGGILVTDNVASFLTEEPLSELKDPVEGRKVLLVVNPLLGA